MKHFPSHNPCRAWLHRFAILALSAVTSATGADQHLNGLFYYRPPQPREARTVECDVAAYGGTPAGVTAAIQAARMGRKAVLVSFNGHVGGLTSGGLTATDIGDRKSIGGLANEFYQGIGKIKDFSPSAAEEAFRRMLEEAGVEVILNAPLESVETKDGRIVSMKMEGGETIRARMFIDGTYEGDLMAAAGVSYQVGREPRSAYGESLAGQWQQVSWKGVYQFCGLPISPYVHPGDPESGLLPGIASDPAGKPGQGDYRIQAYNFRMYLSNKPGKVPFPKPQGYDPGRYALLARFLNIEPRPTWTLNYTTRPMTDGPVQMRNGDSNNAGSFSTDHVDGAHHWPDGTYEPVNFSKLPEPRRGLPMPMRALYQLREKIFQDHVSYQLGLLYFLAHDPQVPDKLQERVRKFGLDPEEFKETGHWPHQLYVREGRRMVSDYVMTQADCERTRIAEDSVGLASYAMDSHFCQRVVVEENGHTTVRNEGGFGHPCKNGPYPVAYRSIVPKREECTNLLVPVGLSASHVAFGSIRMEPVFMILGQSAGTAAAMAIDADQPVQDVPYAKLRERLEKQGQRL
ncbi:FAD-dependent oxidoreductase [Haloferula sp. A504]|uniref:FAD-dependent oxidoreductase n=1 Tax=Haloferula sp. A504 TaxID=3373601 RepID=UPI0031C77A9B|nr:FAD-dependent oxidoreductase [Verrucomicrobiaceae bacterium E54]